MNCPFCKSENTKVIDKRNKQGENTIRRRRECKNCKMRFTTYEKAEQLSVMVVKSSQKREPFEREKLKSGISKSIIKHRIKPSEIDLLVDKIESKITLLKKDEINSQEIGEIVLEVLKETDLLSYILFSTVYKKFDKIEEISDLIKNI